MLCLYNLHSIHMVACMCMVGLLHYGQLSAYGRLSAHGWLSAIARSFVRGRWSTHGWLSVWLAICTWLNILAVCMRFYVI